MLGIIPFLIQWLALSQFSNRNFQTNYQSYPLKSHWTLLSELQQFPEEELENFLPQLCNILLDRETISDDALFEFFERILVDKCEKSLLFGAKVSCYLKVW